MKIAILGGGSWGTALGMHLARKGYSVKIWEFFEEQAKKMEEERVCPLLPEVKLAENIFVSSQMEEVIPETDLVLVVVPSDKVRVTVEAGKEFLGEQPIIICSKGLGEELELMTELVGGIVDNELFCFYGPTHAEEVGKGMFSGAVLAGSAGKLEELKGVMESEEFKVETCEDVVGVQVSAALKNIVAVLVGVLDGMSLGDNAKAYVMTKGLEEITCLGLKMGAQAETFYGLAGMGDVIVTSMSKHSRNRHVGEQIGKGRKLDSVVKEMKMVAEGITTVKLAVKLGEKYGVEMKLVEGLYQVLFEGKKVEGLLKSL